MLIEIIIMKMIIVRHINDNDNSHNNNNDNNNHY